MNDFFISEKRFKNESGNLFFKNKEDILRQYYKRILKKPFPQDEFNGNNIIELSNKLEKGEITFEEFFKQTSIFGSPLLDAEVNLMFHFQEFGIYANITQDFVDGLAQFIGEKKVLEVCANTGYLASGLLQKGIDIITSDLSPAPSQFLFTKVLQLDALEALEKFGTEIDYVLLTWSPLYDEIDYLLLEKMREINKINNKRIKMIVVGELGGCTNSEKFTKHLRHANESEFDSVRCAYESWNNIKDSAYLVE